MADFVIAMQYMPIESVRMRWAEYSARNGEKKNTGVRLEKAQERDRLDDIGVDGRRLLK